MSDRSYDETLSTRLKRTSAALAAGTSLARAPAGEPLPFADSQKSRLKGPRHRYRYGLGAGVAVAVPLITLGVFPGGGVDLTKIHLPGLTITALAQTQATPQLSSREATAAATEYLDQAPGNMDFNGYSVTNTSFEAAVTDAVWECGSLSLPSPQNVWVIEATAPPQQGWNAINATVLVNDDTGQASWVMATSSNGPLTQGSSFSSVPGHGEVTQSSSTGCR